MKKIRLMLWIMMLFPCITMAQTSKSLRVEIEPKSSAEDYFIAPAGKEGVVVFNETDDKSETKGQKIWNFSLYDVMFKEKWNKTASVPKGMGFTRFHIDGNNLYILLVKGGNSESQVSSYSGDFSIIRIDLSSANISLSNGKLPYNTTIEDFKVYNNIAYFGGKEMPSSGAVMGRMCLLYCTCCIPALFGLGEFKTNASLITTDLTTGKTSFPPIVYKGNSNMTSINVDEETGKISCFVSNKPDTKTNNAFIHEFDKSAKALQTIKMNPGDNEITKGKITTLGADNKYIVGTYSLPTAKKGLGSKLGRVAAPTSSAPSQGIYISKVEKGKQVFIKYYSFTDFKNFFSYLDKRSEAKVEKNINKKKDKGEELQLSYNILVHDLIEKDGKIYFIGECYYAEYHTERYLTTDANGRSTYQTRRVFDGYRYTHAVVASFDKTGKLLWDATFPIWDILTFNLKERIKVLHQGNKMRLVYSYSGMLVSKLLANSNLEDVKETTPIETGNSNDKVKSTFSNDVIYWYDNYFVAWGYQKIKSVDEDNKKKKRLVFYFNKVAY